MNEHVDDRIVAYVDGELADREAARVAAHVEVCAQCARLLRETRAVIRTIETDDDAQPLTSMWPEVESRLGRRAPVFDLPFAAATAAALTVGVMLGILTFDRNAQQVTPVAEIASATDAWSAENEMLLADIYLTVPAAAETSAP